MRFSTLIALFAFAPGCLVYADGYPGGGGPSAPTITYADAGCYWDHGYRDYVVYFDADITDDNGGLDVAEVWADVYDDVSGGWVDGFELYPEQGVTWYSAWVASSTWVDCGYPYYSADITATGFDGQWDVATVYLAPG